MTRKRASHKPRTLALFRKAGYIMADCEKRIPRSEKDEDGEWRPSFAAVTKDLFGLADICGFHSYRVGVTFVQVCAASAMAPHLTKAIEGEDSEPALRRLLATDNRFLIIGWEAKLTGVKTCKKCKGTGDVGDGDLFLEDRKPADCPKCKGRGFTGGQRRWRYRLWEITWKNGQYVQNGLEGVQSGSPPAPSA